MADRATHIGYQAPNNYVNPDNILKGYLAASQVGAKQQQKDDLKQRGVYDKATMELKDFTSDISPNLQSFVAESLGGIRNQMFGQYNTYAAGGDNATHNQMYMNNASNEFQMFAAYGKGFEKHLLDYEKRTSEGKSSNVESGYFAKRFAAQADFTNKKMVLDNDGHLWMMQLDENGKFLSRESMSINQLNNMQALHQDKVTFTDYTQGFSKNIKQFKESFKAVELGLGAGERVTLEGMAMQMNNVPNSGGKQAFEEMYQNTIDGITQSMITQPNVGAAALTENLAPNGQPYFFYNDKGDNGRQFSLNGRDPENGIYMATDGDLHERAVLTDNQKELLKDNVTDMLNTQIGFKSTTSSNSGYYRRLNKKHQASNDIALAMKMRMGDENTWKDVIQSWNENSKTKDDEKILSYRVDPNGVSLTFAGGSADRQSVYEHPFSGEDAGIIKSDISALLRYVNPTKYGTVGQAMDAFDLGKDSLPPDAKAFYDKGYVGTRGTYSNQKLHKNMLSELVEGFSFVEVPSSGNQTFQTNLANFIDKLSEGTQVNFDPVTGGKDATSPIIAIKTTTQNPVTLPGGATTTNMQTSPSGLIGGSAGLTGDDYLNSINTDAVTALQQAASSADRVFTEITVKGGPDGNATQTFKFRHDFRGNDPNNMATPTTAIQSANETTYKDMLKFMKEPLRDQSAYNFPAGSFSANYLPGMLNFR